MTTIRAKTLTRTKTSTLASISQSSFTACAEFGLIILLILIFHYSLPPTVTLILPTTFCLGIVKLTRACVEGKKATL
jgi:hypothetical protein